MQIDEFIPYFNEQYDLRPEENIIAIKDRQVIDNLDDKQIVIYTLHHNMDSEYVHKALDEICHYFTYAYDEDIFELYSKSLDLYKIIRYLKYIKEVPSYRFTKQLYKEKCDLYNVDTSLLTERAKKIAEYINTYYNYNLFKNAYLQFICEINKCADLNELKHQLETHELNVDAKYKDVCAKTKMEFINGDRFDLHSIAWRSAMAYSNCFPYSDIFTRAGRLEQIIKFKRADLEPYIRKVWIYKDDDSILLVALNGYTYITDIKTFAQDLKVPYDKLLYIIKNKSRTKEINELLKQKII